MYSLPEHLAQTQKPTPKEENTSKQKQIANGGILGVPRGEMFSGACSVQLG